MALYTVKGSDIPKDHLPLTRRQAVLFQLDLVATLAPAKHSFSILHGHKIASFVGISSSIFINGVYRSCVNIGNYNRLYTFIPLTLAPAFAHFGLHKRFVRDDIIIQKWACPYCYQMRSSIFQVFFGALLPVATSAITAFANARRSKMAEVPALNNYPEIYKFFLKKTKPFSRTLAWITIGQLVFGIAIAQREVYENNYFNKNIEHFIAEYEKNNRHLHNNVSK